MFYEQLVDLSLTSKQWIARFLSWGATLAIAGSFFFFDYPQWAKMVLFIVMFSLYRYGSDIGSPYPKDVLIMDFLWYGLYSGTIFGLVIVKGLDMLTILAFILLSVVYYLYIFTVYKRVLSHKMDEALETEAKEDIETVCRMLAFNEKMNRLDRVDDDKKAKFDALAKKHFGLEE